MRSCSRTEDLVNAWRTDLPPAIYQFERLFWKAPTCCRPVMFQTFRDDLLWSLSTFIRDVHGFLSAYDFQPGSGIPRALRLTEDVDVAPQLSKESTARLALFSMAKRRPWRARLAVTIASTTTWSQQQQQQQQRWRFYEPFQKRLTLQSPAECFLIIWRL